MSNIPPELRQAIIDNKLIAFVGAGLSYDLYNIHGQQIKGWSDLVSNMLIHLQEDGYGDANYLIPLIGKFEPIDILNLVEIQMKSTLEKQKICDFIKDYFDLDHEKNDYSVHKKINELCNIVITTNYDTAFEFSNKNLEKNTAFKGKTFELTKLKNNNSPLLFKLHGCFKYYDSMILFPSDYRQLYNNNNNDSEHLLFSLKNLIFNNTLLFVGSGMGDYQIENIFSTIKNLQGDYNQKHFIITKDKPLDSRLNFLKPIYINDYSEINNILDKLLEIKTNYKSKEQEEIEKLKEDLENTLKKLSELESSIPNEDEIKNKDRLIEKAALIFFIKGIDYQLSQNYADAINEYNHCIEFKPDFYPVFRNFGIALLKYAQLQNNDESEILYIQAFDKFNKALELKSDDYETLTSWGIALAIYAGVKNKTGTISEYENLYTQAFDKFNKALELKSDDYNLLAVFGGTLSEYAELKNETGDIIKAENLYIQAFDKFNKALELKPNDYETLTSFGISLSVYAELKNETEDIIEAENLYIQAFDKFNKSLELKPDNYEALASWAFSLSVYLHQKSDVASEDIYNQIFDKFNRALELKPDDIDILNGYSSSLLDYAKLKNGLERNKILQDIISILFNSIELQGAYFYNYAHANALLNNKEIAFEFLDKSLASKEITIQDIQSDNDWDLFRCDADFIKILKKHKI